MKIAVAICTLNRPEPLSAALESCLNQTRRPDTVIIIDDGDLGDDYVGAWRQRFDEAGVELIYRRKDARDRGLTRSRNLAWKIAATDVILYLDDDAQLSPNGVKYLERTFEADADQAVAGVDFPINEAALERRGRRVIERLYRLAGLWCVLRRFHRPRPVPPALAELKFLRQIPYLRGGAMAMRRCVLETIGGFDETLPGHGLGEDKEISTRLAQRGLMMRITAAEARHLSHPAGREGALAGGYETVYNYLYINKKAFALGIGEAAMLAYTVSGLILIELAFAVAGDRRFHFHQLKGMVSAVWDFVRRRGENA